MNHLANTVRAPEPTEELARLAPDSFYAAIEVSFAVALEWFSKEASASVKVLTPARPARGHGGEWRWHSACSVGAP